MAKRSKTTGGGLSLGKVVLVGVLSIVLLVVIVTQFGGQKRGDTSEPVARRSVEKRSVSTSSSESSAPVAAEKPSEHHPWPTFDVADVVTSNPFMLPEILLPSREAAQTLTPSSANGEAEVNLLALESAEVREMRRRRAEFMAGLRAQGVDMILRSSRGSVARIGELSLRVGDIHEGLRVEEIGKNGVIFAPISITEGQPE